MKVLIVKTSSMGDVIHTLPALTAATKHFADIRFDWVVEEGFAEIPRWHFAVDNVIPVALRRWRKNIVDTLRHSEWQEFQRQLRQEQYDWIIDAQGLIKSAILTRFARGLRCGLNWESAREPLASLFYRKKLSIDPQLHAVIRMQKIFSHALEYRDDEICTDYGLTLKTNYEADKPYIVFLHGTTWKTKEWPTSYWQELAKLSASDGYGILLPWGNLLEYERAQLISQQCESVQILPKSNLATIASILAGAKAVVAVDTGLAHLAAALAVPTVSLYGATDPLRTGTFGVNQTQLKSSLACSPCLNRQCRFSLHTSIFPPCFESLTPSFVWEKTKRLIEQ